ncbi:MAG TPA: hypothetical protein VJ044_18030, partial [Candidatus Hodarchaeales archaeon]|nr:hypothetical protein [Candidatus Hodarchaeales archaeon]
MFSIFKAIKNIIFPKVTEKVSFQDEEFNSLGVELKHAISTIFGKSLAIREIDSGSDNATEIEIVNLSTPYYDIERFGVSIVASPRHADVLLI